MKSNLPKANLNWRLLHPKSKFSDLSEIRGQWIAFVFHPGQLNAAISNLCVVTIRKIGNEGVDIGFFTGLDQFFFRCITLGVQQVVADGSVEEVRFLGNHPDILSQGMKIQVSDIVTVHFNLAANHIVKAGDKIENG